MEQSAESGTDDRGRSQVFGGCEDIFHITSSVQSIFIVFMGMIG
jgi:hypothetical protein